METKICGTNEQNGHLVFLIQTIPFIIYNDLVCCSDLREKKKEPPKGFLLSCSYGLRTAGLLPQHLQDVRCDHRWL